jgi:hypothetical protein
MWHISVIPALGRLRQEDLKLKARLGHIASSRPVWLHGEILPKKQNKQNKTIFLKYYTL